MSTQTIRNGVSLTVNLQPGETLKVVAVTGNYTITGKAGSVAGTAIATSATGGTYGPYASAVTVLLASSEASEVDFDYGTAPAIESDTVAYVSTNPLAGGSALVGPDGEEYPLGSPIVPYADQEFSADDFQRTATGVVCAQRGMLIGVELVSGTSITLTLQDSPDAASGRQVWAMPATTGPRRFMFPKALPFHTGLFATVGGTSPVVRFLLGSAE